MVLAIDIGNSVTAIGLFEEDGALRFRSELGTDPSATRDQCAIFLLEVFRLNATEISAVTGTILSSVVPPATAAMCGGVERLTGAAPMVMGPGVRTGLNIKSDIHAQMGADLVALSVGAIAKYPSPVIVIDMGTAVTLSVLVGNAYEGCVIMPGMRVSLDALSGQAAELPHISIEPPDSILGHNTVEAMRAGIVYGTASMLDGMLERLEAASAPAAAVVCTGMEAPAILPHCKRHILYDADLLLNGLYLVYRKNTVGKQRRA